MRKPIHCPKCGSSVSPNEIFCPICGHQLKVEFYERLLPLFKRVPPTEIRPLSFFGKIKSFFIKPPLVFHNYMLSVRSFLPLLILLVNSFLISLYFMIIFIFSASIPSDVLYIFAAINGLIIFLISFIYNLLFFILLSIIIHLFVKLYEGRGKLKLTLNLLLISSFPLVIHKLLVIIYLLIFAPSIAVPGDLLTSLHLMFSPNIWDFVYFSELFFYGWMAILLTVGLRIGHKISTQNALISSTLSILFFLVLRSFF